MKYTDSKLNIGCGKSRSLREMLFSIAIVAAAASAGVPVSAQELRESVDVEGTYKSDFIVPERINKAPALIDAELGETPLRYESAGVAASFSPSSPSLPATVWGGERMLSPSRGYVDISVGSWLDADVSAGVSLLRSRNNQLNLRLQHNSKSLWRPFKNLWPEGFRSEMRKSYQEQLGIDYYHNFKNVGSISASAQYHFGYFNYFGILPPAISSASSPSGKLENVAIAPTQTLNDAALRLEWESPAARSTRWYAGAGARYFGYRTATRETAVNLRGGLSSEYTPSSSFGVDAEGNILLYSSHEGITNPSNYGALSLTPFYEYRRKNIRLRLGVDLDFTFNADGNYPEEKYGVFHAAPDVRFDALGKGVDFYINITGGQNLHSLAYTAQYDPYRNPRLESTQPVYTPIDLNMGLTMTPFAGFEGRLNLRFASMRHAPMGGWYMASLNDPSLPLPELYRYNLSGFLVGLDLGYRLNGIFRVNFNGTYTPQHDATGIFNGLDRPRWVLNAEGEATPLKGLSLAVGYSYRGVRTIYSVLPESPQTGQRLATRVVTITDDAENIEPEIISRRLGDISNLYFRASYAITRNFSLTFKADNLLNRRHEILPDIPTEGITFHGGLQLLF